MITKKVEDSMAEQVQIVTPQYLNGSKRMFGGQLMKWIDIVAAVVARRHAGTDVTTASVDTLQFRKPAYRNDTVVLKGYMTAAFNTSMEVCVEAYKEHFSGERTLINKAYLVLIAIDENDKPVPVPKLEITNEFERQNYDDALKRYQIRRMH
ncbi:MAG: acyl-CoA thioesterase [Bacillota bacterium]|nr:acyl-CoA thioesterase [Bacillota bacterium]